MNEWVSPFLRCLQPPPALACCEVNSQVRAGMRMGFADPLSPPQDTTQKSPRGDQLSADAIQHLQVFKMKETSKGIIPDHREWVRIQQSENKTGFNRDVVSCEEAISLLLGDGPYANEGYSQLKDNCLGPYCTHHCVRDIKEGTFCCLQYYLSHSWRILGTDGHYLKTVFC